MKTLNFSVIKKHAIDKKQLKMIKGGDGRLEILVELLDETGDSTTT